MVLLDANFEVLAVPSDHQGTTFSKLIQILNDKLLATGIALDYLDIVPLLRVDSSPLLTQVLLIFGTSGMNTAHLLSSFDPEHLVKLRGIVYGFYLGLGSFSALQLGDVLLGLQRCAFEGLLDHKSARFLERTDQMFIVLISSEIVPLRVPMRVTLFSILLG